MTEELHVIEPPCLAALCRNPRCLDLAVLMLLWVASEANARGTAGAASVEVIKVEHHGAYPALGVRGPAPEGTEAALHQLADDLLHRQSISALFDYTASSGLHWRQHALAILGT